MKTVILSQRTKWLCILAAIIAGFMFGASLVFLSSCNRTVIDTTWTFNYGYVKLPTGEVIEGKVTSWKDYDDSDQLQVTINGATYLTHASNVVLVSRY